MEEKDIYKDLSTMMLKVFGSEMLAKGSTSRLTIVSMVESLVNNHGLESVTELQLEGIRKIIDGEVEITHHVSFS